MTNPKLNYVPGSESFAGGMLIGKARSQMAAAAGHPWMEADYPAAKAIVERLLNDGRQIERAEMGLDGDWRENSTVIWEDGEHSEYDSYHGSLWATPMLIVFFEDGPSEAYEVWKPGDAST